MASVISMVSRRGLRIAALCKDIPSKSKLVLYNPLLNFKSFKMLLISNNTKQYYNFKSGCGVRGCCICIEALKEELAWAPDKWHNVI